MSFENVNALETVRQVNVESVKFHQERRFAFSLFQFLRQLSKTGLMGNSYAFFNRVFFFVNKKPRFITQPKAV
jgi:hypothetical protein